MTITLEAGGRRFTLAPLTEEQEQRFGVLVNFKGLAPAQQAHVLLEMIAAMLDNGGEPTTGRELAASLTVGQLFELTEKFDRAIKQWVAEAAKINESGDSPDSRRGDKSWPMNVN